MKRRERNTADELRPEYDMAQLFKGAAQGKYAARFRAGTNLVLVEPEILREFKTDQAVNEALRLVLALRKVGGAGRRVSR